MKEYIQCITCKKKVLKELAKGVIGSNASGKFYLGPFCDACANREITIGPIPFYRSNCTTCNGSGRVPDLDGYAPKPCPKCND